MTVQKKTPERLCIGCQTVHLKKELVRIVRSPEGVFSVDFKGKMPGRGAYICHKPECFDAAVKRRRFEKAFQRAVGADVLEALRAELFPAGT
ncbi:MAG: YlxR family protein [Schwartzia sp.]|nr:YlxR family protein [Schwartzia sp. (in: firmicutes)]